MTLSNVDMTATLRVTYLESGQEVWDKITDLISGYGTYLMPRDFTDLFFFNLPNGEVVNYGNEYNLSDLLIGVGDGATTSFNYTAPVLPIKPTTVTVAYTQSSTQYTATDDGSGALTGTGLTSGSIDYLTGALSLEFDTAPDNGSNILLSYTGSTQGNVGYKFIFGVDENPTVGNPFISTVTVPCNLAKVDWYQTETEHRYTIVMQGTYSGTETQKITGIEIQYTAYRYNDTGTLEKKDYTVLRSVSLATDSLFGEEGLKLRNTCVVKCELTFAVKKG